MTAETPLGQLVAAAKSLIPPPVRQSLRSRWRMLLSPLRMLPGFLIIGAQRCGTTSMYFYLIEHPQILPSWRKEVHYFDHNFDKGLAWYRTHFPISFTTPYAADGGRTNIITGEASPYYLLHPLAPDRVRRTIPEVKLIALLRNPVDRAISQYARQVKVGRQSLSFEEAIQMEVERAGTIESEKRPPHGFLVRGIYVDQLQAWQRLFPEEQILVLSTEELRADPSAVVSRVFAFLDLPDCRLDMYRIYNAAEHPVIDANTRAWLVEYFRPHNERLYTHLSRHFPWDR